MRPLMADSHWRSDVPAADQSKGQGGPFFRFLLLRRRRRRRRRLLFDSVPHFFLLIPRSVFGGMKSKKEKKTNTHTQTEMDSVATDFTIRWPSLELFFFFSFLFSSSSSSSSSSSFSLRFRHFFFDFFFVFVFVDGRRWSGIFIAAIETNQSRAFVIEMTATWAVHHVDVDRGSFPRRGRRATQTKPKKKRKGTKKKTSVFFYFSCNGTCHCRRRSGNAATRFWNNLEQRSKEAKRVVYAQQKGQKSEAEATKKKRHTHTHTHTVNKDGS